MTRKRFTKLLMGDCRLSRNRANEIARDLPARMSYIDYYCQYRMELSTATFNALSELAEGIGEKFSELGTSVQSLANLIHNWDMSYWSARVDGDI